MASHRRTSFENQIPEFVMTENVFREDSLAGAEFENCEIVELFRPDSKLLCEKSAKDRVEVRRGIEIAVGSDAWFAGGVIAEVRMLEDRFHVVAKAERSLSADAVLEVVG